MKKRGFSLAELLIVTAIIAVLTAIAIPIFSQQLEKSRETVDLYNIRTAYSEVYLALTEGTLAPPNETVVLPGGTTATVNYSFFPGSNTFYLMYVYVPFSYKQKNPSNWLISTEWEINGEKIPIHWNPTNPPPPDPDIPFTYRDDKYIKFIFIVNPGSNPRIIAAYLASDIAN